MILLPKTKAHRMYVNKINDFHINNCRCGRSTHRSNEKFPMLFTDKTTSKAKTITTFGDIL